MFQLKARKRSILGKKVKKLRKKDLIPAVVYGHNIPSLNIEIEKKIFEKIFKEAGKTTVIDLIIDSKKTPTKVLIHDLQYDPIKDKIIHVDFYQIKEKEKITTDIELKFVGEAPVVKEKNGILVHHLTKIKIECLPKDLIREIEVNLSSLREFDDLIRVKDLKVPSEIKILHELEDVVVGVSAPKVEEEVKVEEVAKVEEAVEEKKEEAPTP